MFVVHQSLGLPHAGGLMLSRKREGIGGTRPGSMRAGTRGGSGTKRRANVPVPLGGEKSSVAVWGRKAHGILRTGLQGMKPEPTLERRAVALGNN